jgi:hypothetical protein
MAVTSFLNAAGVNADDDTTSVTGSLLSASMRLNKAKKYLLRGSSVVTHHLLNNNNSMMVMLLIELMFLQHVLHLYW